MQFSTKGRYALHFMDDLAKKAGDGFVSLRDFADRHGLSVKYMEQIANTLSKSGLIVSSRGAAGGYRLKKDPGEITVGDILRCTEGSLAPVACLKNNTNSCERCMGCDTIPFWEGLAKVMEQYCDSVTLLDLKNETVK